MKKELRKIFTTALLSVAFFTSVYAKTFANNQVENNNTSGNEYILCEIECNEKNMVPTAKPREFNGDCECKPDNSGPDNSLGMNDLTGQKLAMLNKQYCR